MECALGHVRRFHEDQVKVTVAAFQVEKDKPKCPGFAWIGQELKHCDNCGAPFWEHNFTQEIAREGPFTNPPKWEYKPISEEAKSRVRSQYDRPSSSP